MSEWISVKSDLPKMIKKSTYGESERVLFWVKPKSWQAAAYFGKVIYMPDGEFLCFQVEGFSQDQDVTHWQAVEPPKGVGDE
jgi:hypothetical protein